MPVSVVARCNSTCRNQAGATSYCGDTTTDGGNGETCDDGVANSDSAPNACRTNCKVAWCGDGVPDTGETCDDGGETASCDVDCTPVTCGDGVTNVTAGETCDDNNTGSGDGCSSSCTVEVGFVVYVNTAATGNNDGTSWTHAFVNLQDALDAATQGEIWVAAGNYYPDRGAGRSAGDRSLSFSLKNGVAVYGGFAGVEIARTQRDWSANATVLSGDVGVLNTSTDNSQHLVRSSSVDATAVLDGFIIRDGYSDASPYAGAGMYNTASAARIANCTFTANVARATSAANTEALGGALYNASSNVTVHACVFSNPVLSRSNPRSHGPGVDRRNLAQLGSGADWPTGHDVSYIIPRGSPMQGLEEIIEQAKTLPPDERRQIAEKLLQPADDEERRTKLAGSRRGPYARSLELAGTARSDWTDVSANKNKHLAAAHYIGSLQEVTLGRR